MTSKFLHSSLIQLQTAQNFFRSFMSLSTFVNQLYKTLFLEPMLKPPFSNPPPLLLVFAFYALSARRRRKLFQFPASLYSACRVIDGGFLDLEAEKENYRRVWAVGSLNELTYPKNGRNSINGRDKCLEWLNKEEPNSVLYICFGTTISITNHDQQLEKLADGLGNSEAKLIWVFTKLDNKKEGVDQGKKGHELLQGFEERTKGKGMAVRD
nr:zeatin O-glucosyltransferase-like [Ziziphus jujuba var. spinosa]